MRDRAGDLADADGVDARHLLVGLSHESLRRLLAEATIGPGPGDQPQARTALQLVGDMPQPAQDLLVAVVFFHVPVLQAHAEEHRGQATEEWQAGYGGLAECHGEGNEKETGCEPHASGCRAPDRGDHAEGEQHHCGARARDRVRNPRWDEAAHPQKPPGCPDRCEQHAEHAVRIGLMPRLPQQPRDEQCERIGEHDLAHEVEPLRHTQQMPFEGDGRHHQQAQQRDHARLSPGKGITGEPRVLHHQAGGCDIEHDHEQLPRERGGLRATADGHAEQVGNRLRPRDEGRV